MSIHKPAGSGQEQDVLLYLHESLCNAKRDASADRRNDTMCGVLWDGILCWPPALPGPFQQPCPSYLAGFNPEFNASKFCKLDGEWGNWTNFTQCSEKSVTLLVELKVTPNIFWENYVPLVTVMSEVGFAVSSITLIIAFIVLVRFRRLRCPRNMLHLHLFVSFIMRAFMRFLKRWLFEQGIGPQSDFQIRNGEKLFHQNERGNMECKALTTVWQYFIVANYSWILMEGLYIHNVIMWALSADTTNILLYIILGWGVPLVIAPTWAVARALWDDDLCWTVNNSTNIQYIIQVPTIISVVINFGLFLNILRLLMSKVRSSIQEEAERYWRLAKSTLVLVAVFGVPYFILLGLYSFGDDQVQLAWLLCDQLFASFQGFIVALLYCFLNGEVQDELKKAWKEFSNKGNVVDNTLATTSCASWSSAHSNRRASRGCSRPSRVIGCLLDCASRPDSRSSKRTETVDCIVCEACPSYDGGTRSAMNSNEVCRHKCESEYPEEVEMKLINT